MGKLELCYGTSVLLLFSYFYFVHKMTILREKLKLRFSEEGIEPAPENFPLVEKLMEEDTHLKFLSDSYRESLFNSRVSLTLSLGLLGWCFVL